VPAKAIVPDSDDRGSAWADTNATYSGQWPRITGEGESPTDADGWKPARSLPTGVRRFILNGTPKSGGLSATGDSRRSSGNVRF
jgi:hypothetical protein